jgi:hypothetical protein
MASTSRQPAKSMAKSKRKEVEKIPGFLCGRSQGRFQPYFLVGLGCPSTVAVTIATDNALG